MTLFSEIWQSRAGGASDVCFWNKGVESSLPAPPFKDKGELNTFVNRSERFHPGWCSSVDWALTCKPKGPWFDSQSGHMPGLWARSPVRDACERQPHIAVSLPFSLPSPLSKNKILKKEKSEGFQEGKAGMEHIVEGGKMGYDRFILGRNECRLLKEYRQAHKCFMCALAFWFFNNLSISTFFIFIFIILSIPHNNDVSWGQLKSI